MAVCHSSRHPGPGGTAGTIANRPGVQNADVTSISMRKLSRRQRTNEKNDEGVKEGKSHAYHKTDNGTICPFGQLL